MNVDYNTETQEITVELNTPSIELDTPTGGRGLKGDTGSQGPKGDKGDTGNAATVVVGSTTTGDAGTSASVSNSGTAYAAVLDFTIPKGDKGDTGLTGQDGVSPTVSTSKVGKTTTITITDVNGTSTATILDGEDASDEWGAITGTLSDQTDLQSALNSKADSSDIPTKVSDLTNDSGYITSSSLPTKVSDLTNDSGFITSSSLPTKVSDLTNDTGFITNTVNNLTNYYTTSNTYTKSEVDSLVATVSSLDIEVVQTLPTQDISTSTIYLVPNSSHGANNYYDEYIYVSNSWELIGSTQVDLSNYYTKTETDTLLGAKADSSSLSTVATSGSYNDLSNKPTIPTVGNSKVYYGTCGSNSNQNKVATISGYTLEIGNIIRIKFSNASGDNASPTLDISSTGAKTIVAKNTLTNFYWDSNEIVEFVYDGTNYVINDYGYATTSKYGFTQLSSATNSTSEGYAATPKAVKEAYDLADGKQDKLVSGTNIKKINNTSLLGSGNITVSTFDGDYNHLTNQPTIPTNLSVNEIEDVLEHYDLKNLSYLYAEREDWEIYVGNLDTTNTTNMTGMFQDCVNLDGLFILDFDFTNVTSYSNIFTNCGANNDYPTNVYVKDQAAQDWILNLSNSDRPADWTSDNVIIGGIG